MSRALVTGANRGIGLELVRQLSQQGYEVVAVCRTSSRELQELGVQVIENVDVANPDAVARLVEALDGCQLDLLINNAGLLTDESLDDLDLDRILRQLEVNAVAPLSVTASLRPYLAEGAKVALITSRMGSIEDNTSGGRYGYRMSKAALNMAGKSLAYDLAGQRVAVAIIHPGFVRTGMTGGQGLVDPDESATGILARLDELTMESSGSFWHANGERLPW